MKRILLVLLIAVSLQSSAQILYTFVSRDSVSFVFNSRTYYRNYSVVYYSSANQLSVREEGTGFNLTQPKLPTQYLIDGVFYRNIDSAGKALLEIVTPRYPFNLPNPQNPSLYFNGAGAFTIPAVSCDSIKNCLGISTSGDTTKFLNQQGDFVMINASGDTSYWTQSGPSLHPTDTSAVSVDVYGFSAVGSSAGGLLVSNMALGILPFSGTIKALAGGDINFSGLIDYGFLGGDPADTSRALSGYLKSGVFYGLNVGHFDQSVSINSENTLTSQSVTSSLQATISSYWGLSGGGHGITATDADSSLLINSKKSITSTAINISSTATNTSKINSKYELHNNPGDSLETNTASLIRDVYVTGPDAKFTRNTGAGTFSNIHPQGIASGNYAAAGSTFENIYQYASNNKVENNTINTTYTNGVPHYAWLFQNDNCVFSGNYMQGSSFAWWDTHQGENDSIFDNIVTGYGAIMDNVIQVVNDKFNHNRFTADSFSLANVLQDGESNFEHDTVSGTGFTVRGIKTIYGSSIYDCNWSKYHGFMEGVTLNSSILNRCSGNMRNMYLFNYQSYNDTTDHENQVWFGGSGVKIADGTQGAGKVLKSDSTGKASWQPSNVGTYQYETPTVAQTVNANGSGYLIIDPAGTLASLTVAFPTSPVDGQLFNVSFTQVISAITFTSSGTIKGAPSVTGANNGYGWIWIDSISTWVKAHI